MDKREMCPYGGRGQIFIAKVPEDITMRKPGKAKAKDTRSSKRGNIWPVNGSVSKGWLIQRNNSQKYG
jgi:hypothetical protein